MLHEKKVFLLFKLPILKSTSILEETDGTISVGVSDCIDRRAGWCNDFNRKYPETLGDYAEKNSVKNLGAAKHARI